MCSVTEMDQFDDRIWIGPCEGAHPDRLAEKGITAVVNLTADEFDYGDLTGFHYYKVGQEDGRRISKRRLGEYLAWMDLTLEAGHRVYLHCHLGASRTPSFLIAWLIHHHGVPTGSSAQEEWDRWLGEITAIRAFTAPHPELQESVIRYFTSQ